MELFSKYRNELGLLVAIVCVLGFTLLFNQDYLRKPGDNLQDILQQTSLLGIFTLGAAIVIIAGGIDLSSGSAIAFSASVCALVMTVCAPKGEGGAPDVSNVGLAFVLLAIGAALVVGFLIGTLHTWLITIIRLPPFVATLASLVGLRSLAKVLNPAVTAALGNKATTVRADDATLVLLSAWWVPLTVFLVLSAGCYVLMNHSVVGRHLYALGGNEEAARLSGIRTDRLKWLAYSLGGIFSSIAGVLYLAKVQSANPATLGVGFELNAIAAAVVGGCSLSGGVGLIPGVMLGVLFLQVVIDAVAKLIKDNSDDYQGMIVGLLVVLAVALNELRRARRGQRVELFSGALGLVTMLILAGLTGLMGALTVSGWAGTLAGGVALVALVAVRFVQRRPQAS